MYNGISNTYQVLSFQDFFKQYNKSRKDTRFISKGYSQSNNCVAVFEDELKYNCYFQCPDYGESYVPENRRYIYLLEAGTYDKLPHTINTAENGKKRISININNLKIFADPYDINDASEDIIKDEITPEMELIGKIRRLTLSYQEKMEKLMKDYEQLKNIN